MSANPSKGLEFLGALAGGLVHEIKNPLSTVRINLTLLREDLAQAHPEDRGSLHRIDLLEREVARLDAILNDFMRYAGMRRLHRQRADLAAVVQETLDFVEPGLARSDIELRADLTAVSVELDAPLFKQALLNVLLNAQQAIDGNGTIDAILTTDGGTATLRVRDTGCGIAADEMERVFTVYYSRSKAGSGLGLPTARRIVEEHRGALTLESELGVGSTVVITLPCAPEGA